jgi:large subunit ribosomal protein L13
MKTYSPSINDVDRHWYAVDADGQILGRLAAEVARILMGKHKPTWTPHLDTGDYVVIVNAAKVRVTGNKLAQKMYQRHSGYPGGFRERPLSEMMQRFPDRVVEEAVRGMLPHNRLGAAMLKKLRVYAGPTHRQAAQQPTLLKVVGKRGQPTGPFAEATDVGPGQ